MTNLTDITNATDAELDALLGIDDDPFAVLFTPEAIAEAARENEARLAREAADKADRERMKCRKCGGTGHLRAYMHVEGGQCFRCGGAGYGLASPGFGCLRGDRASENV